jgi:FAD-linked sulfhydryl oxidase
MWRVVRRFIGPPTLVVGTLAIVPHRRKDSPYISHCDGAVSSHIFTSSHTQSSSSVSDGKMKDDKTPASQHNSHKDCENPVCKSTSDMFRKALKGTSTTTTSTSTTSPTPDHPPAAVRCPLNRDSLGREAWDVIHTVAAYYPDHPSAEQRAAADAFIRGLAVIYPCTVCAADFQQSLIDNPPR